MAGKPFQAEQGAFAMNQAWSSYSQFCTRISRILKLYFKTAVFFHVNDLTIYICTEEVIFLLFLIFVSVLWLLLVSCHTEGAKASLLTFFPYPSTAIFLGWAVSSWQLSLLQTREIAKIRIFSLPWKTGWDPGTSICNELKYELCIQKSIAAWVWIFDPDVNSLAVLLWHLITLLSPHCWWK